MIGVAILRFPGLFIPSFLGEVDWHSLALLLGVTFMFWGYLQATFREVEGQAAQIYQ